LGFCSKFCRPFCREQNLNPAQLAMIGARAKECYEKAAKEWQRFHGNTAPGKSNTLLVNLSEVKRGDAMDQAGKAVGISARIAS
jgi:hypothetical protein